MVRRRKRKRPWKTASGFKTLPEAIERRNYLASRKGRRDQVFKVERVAGRYPWEVQFRSKK